MISTNALLHTFFIKTDQYGTAFSLEVDGSEFLVTARHLIDPVADQVSFQIFLNDQWLQAHASVIGRGRNEVDIAVLQITTRLTPPGFRFTPAVSDFSLGQDVYFLGFPYKMWGDVGTFLAGRPCAFGKKGTLSFVSTTEAREFFVDAINNEGYSGGPLFYYPTNDVHDIRVIAVVSKFRVEHEQVLGVDGEPTGMTVPYNTGFLVAYGIRHVLDIIKLHQSV